MFSEIAILLVSILFLSYFWNQWRLPKNLPPGPRQLPVIGNVLQLATRRKRRPFEIFHELSKKYGPVVYMKIGILPQIILEDYKNIKEVLNCDIWVDRFFNDFIAERSFGKELGILVVNGGDNWKEMRRFTLRTLRDFGFGKQKSMEETLNEEFEDLTKSLSNFGTTSTGSVVDMHRFFTISVLNILWNMIAGYRFSLHNEKLHQLLNLLDKLIRANPIGSPIITAAISFPIVRQLLFGFTHHNQIRKELYKNMQQFFQEILQQRRAEGHYKDEQRDFVDVFLCEIDGHAEKVERSNYYTDEQFVAVCMDLFMAGSETTSNTLEFAILYMILNPEVQKKVQGELDSVIGQNRTPSLLDKPNLPYTEATLLETQRMANVVPIIIRTPNEDTMVGGYTIPKDTLGVINFHAMHMNEKEWTEPEKFKPERFLDKDGNVINANKILPFGAGKRSCLGEVLARATLFTFFTTFLQKFTFSQSPNHPPAQMKSVLGFTLSPKPYHALVTQRF